MKHPYSIIMAVLLAFTATTADAITRQKLINYASQLKGLKKAELKTAMYNLMKEKTVLSYGSGKGHTWEGFYKTDRDPKTNECYNRYSSQKFYFANGNTNKAIDGMNIEHSFPKSWWGGANNDGYKDLYNLYPSDSKANSSKGNYPMAVVTNIKSEDPGYDKVGTGTVDGNSGETCWEPGDQYKGDFSRGYMYMGVTYSGLTFEKTGLKTMTSNASGYPGMKTWATTLYRQWSKQDKVDSLEVTRNDAVYSIQGNRNLFIDFPYLAEYVWGDSTDVAFDPTTSITTASDDNRYGTYTPSPDDPNVNPNPSYDGWIFAKLTTLPTVGKRYLIVANNSGSLLAAKPVTTTSSKNYGYLYTTSVTESDSKISLASDVNAFTFESATNGFYIKDSNGKYYYQDGTYSTFTPTDDTSKADVWTVTQNTDGTFIIKASDSGNAIMYSTKFKSFGNYSSKQSTSLYPYLYEEQDKTTGIDAIQTSQQPKTADNAVYTIQGVRVNSDGQLPPGIYIKGGKKFIVRQ